MKFKVDGRTLDATSIRVGELCEAEKTLQVNMADGSGAALAVSLFVAMRREDKDKPAALIADEVMRADVTTFEEADEESPPAEGSDAENSSDPENPPTSGAPSSEPTA